ncbi:transposase family protein [Pseudonocardia aurantiaca]|uniref:Transposase family protein n=1 Tax=Pseudonocardia aurantiaca TaxID=75290 RepID=A0ABW4FWL6_9PSEU
MVFSTHHASSEEPRLVPYRATLDVRHELLEHVSWLIYARRCELRSRWWKLRCFQQTLFALVHLRKNETLPVLAADFGIATATAWRYVDETLDVLAAWAPGLHEALTGLGKGDYVIVDGTLIPIDRIAADEPYCSKNHRKQPEHYQQFNRDHARQRAFAQLKSWRILRRARCSTRRISTIVQAVHTLLTCDYSG